MFRQISPRQKRLLKNLYLHINGNKYIFYDKTLIVLSNIKK